jgi:hypothetical protein
VIDIDTLADLLAGDDPSVRQAAAVAEARLRALREFRPPSRHLYPREARRIARRAALALDELLEVARAAGQATSRK